MKNDQELQRILLDKYYKKRLEDFTALKLRDFDFQVDQSTIFRVSLQLCDLGLIVFKPLTGDDSVVSGRGKITALGIQFVELGLHRLSSLSSSSSLLSLGNSYIEGDLSVGSVAGNNVYNIHVTLLPHVGREHEDDSHPETPVPVTK